MKMTIHEAVENHKKLWQAIADSIRVNGIQGTSAMALKKEVRRKLFPELNNENIKDDCFLCEYVMGQTPYGCKECARCPMMAESHSGCLNGLFSDFVNACCVNNTNSAILYAQQIAELPVINSMYLDDGKVVELKQVRAKQAIINAIVAQEIENLESGLVKQPETDWEKGHNFGVGEGLVALKAIDKEVISIQEVKKILMDMYLEVANNFSVSDLHHDSDKVSVVAAKCRQTANEALERAVKRKQPSGALMRRGTLYNIILNATNDNAAPSTYENVKFLQQLVDDMYALPARKHTGEIKGSRMMLDTDLVSKQEMIIIMEKYKESDDKAAIVEKITADINDA